MPIAVELHDGGGGRFAPLSEVYWTGAGRAERASIAGRALVPLPSAGDRLPRVAGVLRWVDDAGAHRLELRWEETSRPAPVAAAMVSKCVALLRCRCNDELPSPFNYGVVSDVAPAPMELEQFERHRVELRRVCERPAVELLPEDLWMPVHKVRRLARSAVSALARSPRALAPPSGPLERLGLRSPMPLRVLAELRDESLDRYENHVVADLVARLSTAIGRWILDLDNVRSTLGEALEDAQHLRRLGQRVRHEELGRLISQLRGGADEFETGLGLAIERAGTARSSLGSLRAGNLLTGLSPRKVVPPLKLTNLFAHDPAYAPLGDCWQKVGGTSADPFDPVADDPDVGYRDFALLVLCRGLEQLGFAAQSAIPFAARDATAPVSFENSSNEGTCRSVEVRRDGLLDLKVTFQFEDEAGAEGRIQYKRGKVVRGQVRGKTATEQWSLRPRFLRLGESVALSSFSTSVDRSGVRPLWLIADVDRGRLDAESAQCVLQPFPVDAEGLCLVVGPLHLASADRVKAWLLGQTLGRDLRRGTARRTCPVCAAPGSGSEGDCWCSQCGAAWGWESCSSCSARLPKLVPQRPDRKKLAEVSSALHTPWSRARAVEIAFGAWRVGPMAVGAATGSFSWVCSCRDGKSAG